MLDREPAERKKQNIGRLIKSCWIMCAAKHDRITPTFQSRIWSEKFIVRLHFRYAIYDPFVKAVYQRPSALGAGHTHHCLSAVRVWVLPGMFTISPFCDCSWCSVLTPHTHWKPSWFDNVSARFCDRFILTVEPSWFSRVGQVKAFPHFYWVTKSKFDGIFDPRVQTLIDRIRLPVTG